MGRGASVGIGGKTRPGDSALRIPMTPPNKTNRQNDRHHAVRTDSL